MFKKIVLPLVFSASFSNAQISRQVIQQIQKANRSDIGVPQTSEPCDVCSSNKKVEDLFYKCVQTICRSKGLVPYTEIPALRPEDLAKPAANEKEIEGLFHELDGIKSAFSSKEERNLLVQMLRNGQLNASEENLKLAMQLVTSTVGSRVTKFDPASRKFSLDEEKWKALSLPGLSKKNKNALKEHVKVYCNLVFNDTSDFTSAASTDGYFATKYPGLSKAEAVKKLVSDFKADFEGFKTTRLGILISQITDTNAMFPSELVADVESGNDITDMTLQELIKSRNNFSALQMIFDSKKYESASSLIDFADLRKQLQASNIVNAAADKMNKQDEKEKKENQDRLASCLSIYRRNLLTMPTKPQIDKIKQEIQQLKKTIQDRWASHYSSETQRKIAQYLTQVDFFLPHSKEDYQESFKQRIQREIQSKKRQQNLRMKDREALSFFLALSVYSEQFKTAEERSEPDTGFCDNDKVSPMTDSNYTMLGKIQVSYTTVTAPQMGLGVLAHEIGHGISQIFQSKSASEQSSKTHRGYADCLASLHEKNGSQYVEEDYADFVAANVTDVNKACLYPESLSAKLPALENEYASDTHSSNFFRLLHVESIQKNKLPDECNQLLVEQKTPKDFMLCERKLAN